MYGKLTFADGKTVENAQALVIGARDLYLYIASGYTFKKAYSLLSKPERVQTIQAEQYGETAVHEGYTELVCLKLENNGQVTAILRKAE